MTAVLKYIWIYLNVFARSSFRFFLLLSSLLIARSSPPSSLPSQLAAWLGSLCHAFPYGQCTAFGSAFLGICGKPVHVPANRAWAYLSYRSELEVTPSSPSVPHFQDYTSVRCFSVPCAITEPVPSTCTAWAGQLSACCSPGTRVCVNNTKSLSEIYWLWHWLSVRLCPIGYCTLTEFSQAFWASIIALFSGGWPVWCEQDGTAWKDEMFHRNVFVRLI